MTSGLLAAHRHVCRLRTKCYVTVLECFSEQRLTLASDCVDIDALWLGVEQRRRGHSRSPRPEGGRPHRPQ